jgi:hypothetical protein
MPDRDETKGSTSGVGVMFAMLEEQHTDHLILSDGSQIRLADGLILEPLGSGARLTITYTRDGGGAMVAQRIKRSDLPRLSDRA